MRVLIVNTSERTGGAAVAANRLMDALNNHGVKVKMLVREKETDSLTVVGLNGRWRQQWYFLWERLVIFCHLHFSRKHLFEIACVCIYIDPVCEFMIHNTFTYRIFSHAIGIVETYAWLFTIL